jgi:hypothetical protein
VSIFFVEFFLTVLPAGSVLREVTVKMAKVAEDSVNKVRAMEIVFFILLL